MKNETGRLGEDFAIVYEAAERVAGPRSAPEPGGSARTLVGGGLEVTRAGDDAYEVRHEGLLVFRCRGGERPEVFKPGEWVVRLVHAGRSARPEEEGP